jgi:hypothetical protein
MTRTMIKHLRPRSTNRRRIISTLAVISLALFGLVATSGPAIATVSSDAGFEFADANLAHGSAMDWNDFATTTWTGTAPYKVSNKTVSGWAFRGLQDAEALNADTGFAGGTKQDADCPSVVGSKAPNKDDLKRVYISSKTVGGDVFLGLAWERIPQNTTSPSAHIGFEFNSDGPGTACAGPGGLVTRAAGDMLIVYDFEGGSASPVITLRRWVTSGACEVGSDKAPCWGLASNLTQLGFAEALVNTTATASDTISPTSPAAASLGLSEFGEAGVNLTDAGVFSSSDCSSFGKAYAVSRSSGNSGTAQMKDLVGPGDVNISNCGNIVIQKVTDPSPDTSDTSFDFTLTGGASALNASFSLKDGESNTTAGADVLAGTGYNAAETVPSGWSQTGASCDDGSPVTNIDVSVGETVTCTFTNTLQQGALQILKQSTKSGNPLVANAGAVFSYGSASVTDNGAGDEDSDVGEVCVSGLTPDDYTVNETTPPSGYGAADASQADQTATVVAGTNCGDNPPGAGATATFTNAPLSDIQVNFRDDGSGETSADISCDDGTGEVASAATGWHESATHTGISAPTTIVCTIVIDP